jgi:nucleoside-diphosphate-sugar epimerase
MRWPISIYPAFFHNPVVYAADVAEGVARILEIDASAGRAYNLAGEPGTTSWDFLRAWREAGGYCPRVTIPIPLPVRMRLSISRAKEELGWQNRPMREGIRELLAVEAAGPAQRRIDVPSAN